MQLDAEQSSTGLGEYTNRLGLLKNVIFQVVESDVDAIVIGASEFSELLKRRDEDFDHGATWENDDQEVLIRLEEPHSVSCAIMWQPSMG